MYNYHLEAKMSSSSHQARMGRGTTRGEGQRKWDGGDKDDDGGSSGNLKGNGPWFSLVDVFQ